MGGSDRSLYINNTSYSYLVTVRIQQSDQLFLIQLRVGSFWYCFVVEWVRVNGRLHYKVQFVDNERSLASIDATLVLHSDESFVVGFVGVPRCLVGRRYSELAVVERFEVFVSAQPATARALRQRNRDVGGGVRHVVRKVSSSGFELRSIAVVPSVVVVSSVIARTVVGWSLVLSEEKRIDFKKRDVGGRYLLSILSFVVR
ncbi:hypothetical protein BCR33DRAFT_719056 [Rhizoclosmatium globosum]|uniref:Uncharacterized protein n=1 Tax=Rhizoclosmatium globosum TaxID=329046 RepID=A0A1Y2C218_9FUNG|nr:hypothetical protein BCR33DRAFT_719056 [Rhizoclosmatium globosum]|eukprot:ORY40944.1 hypothetical protein BCR33DRAFT_719056 [Rhizoclosmatium globosum]